MTHYAIPKNAAPHAPSVVLAMHVSGVDEHMRLAAQRFADAGFAVAVPDLYEGLGAPDPQAESDVRAFMPFAQKLSFEHVDPKIRAAAQSLRERFEHTKTAIAGFCMGGIIALRRTQGYGDIFTAAAIWYGALNDAKPEQIDIPIVASFGADDKYIPLEQIERFEAALGVPHDVKVYPGAGHAFCDETRESYVREAAEDSWRRTIAFLEKFLR